MPLNSYGDIFGSVIFWLRLMGDYSGAVWAWPDLACSCTICLYELEEKKPIQLHKSISCAVQRTGPRRFNHQWWLHLCKRSSKTIICEWVAGAYNVMCTHLIWRKIWGVTGEGSNKMHFLTFLASIYTLLIFILHLPFIKCTEHLWKWNIAV